MTLTDRLRDKYQLRCYGSQGSIRHAPGGEDVLRLCRMVDELTQLVRDLQRSQPEAKQNEIEQSLWRIENL